MDLLATHLKQTQIIPPSDTFRENLQQDCAKEGSESCLSNHHPRGDPIVVKVHNVAANVFTKFPIRLKINSSNEV